MSSFLFVTAYCLRYSFTYFFCQCQEFYFNGFVKSGGLWKIRIFARSFMNVFEEYMRLYLMSSSIFGPACHVKWQKNSAGCGSVSCSVQTVVQHPVAMQVIE